MRTLAFGLTATLVACGGQIIGGGADGGGDVIQPPPPDLCAGAGSCSAVFVMQRAFLGDTTRESTGTSTTAWKSFGENVDGKVSDAKSTDVCARQAGAPSSVQSDGTAGIDNSFGANIVPIVQSAGSIPNPSQLWTNAIASGVAHTLLFVIDIKGSSVTARLVLAAPLGKSAAFDGSDAWPVSGLSTQGGVAQLDFPAPAILADGTLISGRASQRGLVVWDMNGAGWPMPIDGLQFRLTLAPGLKSATNGTFSGVLPTEPFIDSLRQTAGNVSKSLCGSAFDGIAQQMRQCQEILANGTNSAGAPCSGISIGMGFEVARAQLGPPVNEAILKSCP